MERQTISILARGRGSRPATVKAPPSTRSSLRPSWRDANNTVSPLLPDLQQAAKLYGYVDRVSGLRAVPQEYRYGSKNISVSGHLFTRDGNEAGEFSRWMSLEPTPHQEDVPRLVAKNSFLDIQPKYQNQGFGRRYTRLLDRRYRELGVHRREAWATKMGRVVWATPEMQFADGHGYAPGYLPAAQEQWMRAQAAAEMWGRYPQASYRHPGSPIAQRWHKEGNLSEEQIQAIDRMFLDQDRWGLDPEEQQRRMGQPHVSSPYEILQLGRDWTWQDAEGKTTWPGRDILLNNEHGWEGYVLLQGETEPTPGSDL